MEMKRNAVFYSEIWTRIFRTLWTWFCFADFGLESENKSVFLLLLHRRFKTFEILSLFSSISLLCDRIEFVAFSDEFNAWIAEEKAQWWRFNLESLRANTNSIDLAWIQFWKRLGFVKLFLNFLSFCDFDLTEWRESVGTCLWCGVIFVAPFSDWYSEWPFIGCHVCFWTNEITTPGLGTACVALDWILQKRLKD